MSARQTWDKRLDLAMTKWAGSSLPKNLVVLGVSLTIMGVLFVPAMISAKLTAH